MDVLRALLTIVSFILRLSLRIVWFSLRVGILLTGAVLAALAGNFQTKEKDHA
jgi:hypothetical protein